MKDAPWDLLNNGRTSLWFISQIFPTPASGEVPERNIPGTDPQEES